MSIPPIRPYGSIAAQQQPHDLQQLAHQRGEEALKAAARALTLGDSDFKAALQRAPDLEHLASARGVAPEAVKAAMSASLAQQLQAGTIDTNQYNRLAQLNQQLTAGAITLSRYLVLVRQVD
jgi:hypothetical protein